jgi:nickel/cobalt exporter
VAGRRLYFQLVAAALIVAIALWMLWRTWQDQQRAEAASGVHDHGPAHHGDHGHGHSEGVRRIDTGHGVIAVEVFEEGVPPRWRIRAEKGHAWAAKDVAVVTERPDGARQAFTFADRGGYLESVDEIPEPHAFMARLCLPAGSTQRGAANGRPSQQLPVPASRLVLIIRFFRE